MVASNGGIHGGRDERDVQGDVPGDSGVETYFPREYFGIGGAKEYVIERKAFAEETGKDLVFGGFDS